MIALGCEMSVRTGEFTGVPPEFRVMVTPSTFTVEVVFGTGTMIVVAVLVTVVTEVIVEPSVSTIVAVDVLAGMMVVLVIV